MLIARSKTLFDSQPATFQHSLKDLQLYLQHYLQHYLQLFTSLSPSYYLEKFVPQILCIIWRPVRIRTVASAIQARLRVPLKILKSSTMFLAISHSLGHSFEWPPFCLRSFFLVTAWRPLDCAPNDDIVRST